MTTFLAELGTKLADRWLQALMLPGLLWTGVLAVGVELGQFHPFDVGRLSSRLSRLAAQPAAHAPGTVILAAAAVFLAGAGVGLAAGAGGVLVQRWWALPGTSPPASWSLAWRRRRWDRATEALKDAIRRAAQLTAVVDPRVGAPQSPEARHVQARVRSRQRRMDRLGPTRPVRPSQIGDRFARVGVRAATVNGLTDLPLVWPRLWTVLPESLRSDITAARTAYTAGGRLVAWGMLYTLVGILWWPALLIGAAVLVTGGVQGRAAAGALADLIETAADMHTSTLAEHLGVAPASARADTGRLITGRLAPPL